MNSTKSKAAMIAEITLESRPRIMIPKQTTTTEGCSYQQTPHSFVDGVSQIVKDYSGADDREGDVDRGDYCFMEDLGTPGVGEGGTNGAHQEEENL